MQTWDAPLAHNMSFKPNLSLREMFTAGMDWMSLTVVECSQSLVGQQFTEESQQI
jgi:hypothetical protein